MRLIPKYQTPAGTLQGSGTTTTASWYNNLFPILKEKILSQLRLNPTYWATLNNYQNEHAKLAKNNTNLDNPTKSEDVKAYQTWFNDQTYNDAISQNWDKFQVHKDGSGDNPTKRFKSDGLFSNITNLRYTLGRNGDFTSDLLNDWNKELAELGLETYLSDNDYYLLRPKLDSSYKLDFLQFKGFAKPIIDLGKKPNLDISQLDKLLNGLPPDVLWKIKVNLAKNLRFANTDGTSVQTEGDTSGGTLAPEFPELELPKQKSSWWDKFLPYGLSLTRLGFGLAGNEKIAQESEAAIRPDLSSTFRVGRNVVGDEASKQAYYQKARRLNNIPAFTSDMDKDLAYRLEASDKGMQLESLGDLLDNEIIRKTSAENDELQRGNIQRATEVANLNTKARNYANALKHNVRALKYLADTTNVDNALYELQYRTDLNTNRKQNIADLIYALDWSNIQSTLLNPIRQKLLTLDPNSKEYLELSTKYLQYLYALQRRQLEGLSFAKKGGKLNTSEDYMYNSIKDAVEHFRKMSKLSSDSYNRKRIKIEKLHPTGNTRKMLLGGVAPFWIYKPYIPAGSGAGETTAGKKSSSSKGSEKDEGLEMIKDLFKEVHGKGLPIDAKSLYDDLTKFFQRWKLFGNEMSTSDIASMYINALQKVNMMEHSKRLYDEAKTKALANEATGEYAVTADGLYVVLDKSTRNLDVVSLNEYDPKLHRLVTNNDLIQLRAYSSNMAFADGDLWMGIVNNGKGYSKIMADVRSMILNVGDTELKLSGYTEHQAKQIREGFETLAEAPAGNYKWTRDLKNLDSRRQSLVVSALNFIEHLLSPSSKAIVNIHAAQSGKTFREILLEGITSYADISESTDFQPVTGKAADGTKSGKSGDTELPAVVQFLLGNGYQQDVSFTIGNSVQYTTKGRFGVLQTKNGENLGQGATLQDVSKSQFGTVLDWDLASFGGTRVNMMGANHIFIKDSDCIGVDLPIKIQEDGTMVPDFLKLKQIEKAEKYIKDFNITDKEEINTVYKKHNLNPKYDAQGNEIIIPWARFGAIKVITDGSGLLGEPKFLDEIQKASDENRVLYEEARRKNDDKFELDNLSLLDSIMPFWNNYDKVYEGRIFVPVKPDVVNAFISSGLNLTTKAISDDVTEISMKEHMAKASTYKPPIALK